MIRAAAALLPLLLVSACGPGADESAGPPVANTQGEAVRSQPGTAQHGPVVVRYKPPKEGGPEAFRASIVQGILDFAGPCVRVRDPSGRLATLVTSAGSRLLRDNAGLYLPSGEERLRHGSSVIGGGGEMPALPPDELLDGPVPEACRAGRAIEIVGMSRAPRSPPIVMDAPPSPPAGG